MARGDRYERIIRAAERLFVDRRFHEVTTDDIAQAARVGKGTLYRYFRDKDDLFWHVATHGFDELCASLSSPAAGSGSGSVEGVGGSRGVVEDDFDARLERACGSIAAFFGSRRPWLRVLPTAGSGRGGEIGRQYCARWAAKRGELVAALGRILAEGVAQGRVRDDVSASVLAHVLLGLLRTRAQSESEHPEAFGDLGFVLGFFRRGASPAFSQRGFAAPLEADAGHG